MGLTASNIISLKKCFLKVSALLCLLITALPAFAQNGEQAPTSASAGIKIEHSPPSAKDLPEPGREVQLKFTLQNSKEVTLRARAFVSSDGKSMEVPLSKSYLNESDKAQYEFSVLAPIAEMSYQFVVYSQDGMPSLSARYQSRRSCLPRLQIAAVNASDKADPNMEKQLSTLLRNSNLLEEDLDRYKAILDLIAKLKQEIGA